MPPEHPFEARRRLDRGQGACFPQHDPRLLTFEVPFGDHYYPPVKRLRSSVGLYPISTLGGMVLFLSMIAFLILQ